MQVLCKILGSLDKLFTFKCLLTFTGNFGILILKYWNCNDYFECIFIKHLIAMVLSQVMYSESQIIIRLNRLTLTKEFLFIKLSLVIDTLR